MHRLLDIHETYLKGEVKVRLGRHEDSRYVIKAVLLLARIDKLSTSPEKWNLRVGC